MGRLLTLVGVILVVLGLFWQFGERLGLGKLPGDLTIKGERYAFNFPIVTSIVLSVVATLLLWIVRRFIK